MKKNILRKDFIIEIKKTMGRLKLKKAENFTDKGKDDERIC